MPWHEAAKSVDDGKVFATARLRKHALQQKRRAFCGRRWGVDIAHSLTGRALPRLPIKFIELADAERCAKAAIGYFYFEDEPGRRSLRTTANSCPSNPA